MDPYRLYTLDGTRRIVSCHEVVCTDDRHAVIVSTTLDNDGAEIEIWQNQRFVGLAARRAPGDTLHRPLVTTVDHRSRTGPALARRLLAPRDSPPGKAEAQPGPLKGAP